MKQRHNLTLNDENMESPKVKKNEGDLSSWSSWSALKENRRKGMAFGHRLSASVDSIPYMDFLSSMGSLNNFPNGKKHVYFTNEIVIMSLNSQKIFRIYNLQIETESDTHAQTYVTSC